MSWSLAIAPGIQPEAPQQGCRRREVVNASWAELREKASPSLGACIEDDRLHHARNFDTCDKCARALLVDLPVNLLPLTPSREVPAQLAGEWMSVEETVV